MTATNVSQAFRALFAASLLALIAAVGAGTDSRAAAAVGQPNVVVIMTDDQTVESMRVMAKTREVLGAQEPPSPTASSTCRSAAHREPPS